MKILILSLLLISFFAANVEAKVLPQASKGTAKIVRTSISVYPKLRADRRALIVNFGNLQNAKSVSYMLSYQTDVQQEGAIGTINLTGATSQSQELLFGTCSKGVCRYHTGIKNARLEVTYTSLSGKKSVKRFKIKV